MTVAVIYISADAFISPRMRTPKAARHREILRENKPFALRGPWPRRPKQAVLCPLGGGFVPDSARFDKSWHGAYSAAGRGFGRFLA